MKRISFIIAVAFNFHVQAADIAPIYEKTHKIKDHYDSLDFRFSPDSRYLLERRFSSGTSILKAVSGEVANRNIELATYEFSFSDTSDNAFIKGWTRIEDKASILGWYKVNFISGTSEPLLKFGQHVNVEELLPLINRKLAFVKYKSATESSESNYQIFDFENGSSLCDFSLDKKFQFQKKYFRRNGSLSGEIYFNEENTKLAMIMYSTDDDRLAAVFNCKSKSFEMSPARIDLEDKDRPGTEFVSRTGRYLVVSTKWIRPNGNWGSEVDRVNVFDLFEGAKLVLSVDGHALWDQKNDLLIVQDGAAKFSVYNFSDSLRLERNITAKIQDDKKRDGIYVRSAKFVENRLWLFYEYHSDFKSHRGLGYYDFADTRKDIIHVADNVSSYVDLHSNFVRGDSIIFPTDEELGIVFKKLNLKTNEVQTFSTKIKSFTSYLVSPDGKLLALKNIFNSEGIKETLTVFSLEN
jgi:hypothetical protein